MRFLLSAGWLQYLLAAIAVMLGIYMLTLLFVKPKPVCGPDVGPTDAEAVCISNLKRIIPALTAYERRFGRPPRNPDALYKAGLIRPRDLVCPEDDWAAKFEVRLDTLKALPFPASYGFHLNAGVDPARKSGEVQFPATDFGAIRRKRGDAYPIVFCDHHATPEQRLITCPRVWIVGRLNGGIERRFTFVRSSTEL